MNQGQLVRWWSFVCLLDRWLHSLDAAKLQGAKRWILSYPAISSPTPIRFLTWLQDNTRHTSTYSLQGELFVIAREYMHACMHMPLHFGRSTGGNRGWEKNMCWMILLPDEAKIIKISWQIHWIACFVIYSNSPITMMKHPISWRPPQRSIGVYFGTFDPIHENHVALAKFAFGRPKGWGSLPQGMRWFDVEAPWGS